MAARIKFRMIPLGLLLWPFFLEAQAVAVQNPAQQTLAQENPIDTLVLRPLAELILNAVKNAPALDANRIDLAKQKLVTTIQRKSWTDLFSLNGTAYYGNGVINEVRSDGTGIDYASGRLASGVNLSVGVKLSGGDFFTRSQKTQIQVLQLDRLESDGRVIENQLRDEVTAQYFQLENALAVVSLRAEGLESLRLARAVAEKYFREGNLPLADYTRLLTDETNAHELFLRAQNEAKLRSVALRDLTGAAIWAR